jgi:hypothetical protein
VSCSLLVSKPATRSGSGQDHVEDCGLTLADTSGSPAQGGEDLVRFLDAFAVGIDCLSEEIEARCWGEVDADETGLSVLNSPQDMQR